MRSRIDLGPLNGKRKLESCDYLFRIDISKGMGERIELKQNCMRSNLPRSWIIDQTSTDGRNSGTAETA